MLKLYQKIIISLIITLFFCVALGYWDLKQPYQYPHQRKLAVEFVSLVQQNHLKEAYEMTSRTRFAGMNFAEFSEIVRIEIIPQENYQIAYSLPNQTYGNRLRRYLQGTTIDEDNVTIEFRDKSALRVVLCQSDNDWQVCRFDGHAW